MEVDHGIPWKCGDVGNGIVISPIIAKRIRGTIFASLKCVFPDRESTANPYDATSCYAWKPTCLRTAAPGVCSSRLPAPEFPAVHPSISGKFDAIDQSLQVID